MSVTRVIRLRCCAFKNFIFVLQLAVGYLDQKKISVNSDYFQYSLKVPLAQSHLMTGTDN